jgi:multidrug efflux pump subunit AcrB
MDSKSPSSLTSGGITRFFVEHRLLGWAAVVAVLVWGWFSFQKLPQQEDPTFPTHDAVLVTIWPEAPAAQIETEITAKLEAALSKLPTLEKLQSQTRDNVSSIVITLRTDRKEVIDAQWTKARKMLAEVKLPEGCEEPRLETDFQLPATLLFSVLAEDGMKAGESADIIERELKKVPSTGRIRQFGHPPAEILSFDDMVAATYSTRTLHRETDGPLKPSASVLVAVEMKAGNIIRDFKTDVLAQIEKTKLPDGVRVITVSDQPAATAHRIEEFLRCFIEAVIVVVLVALLLMDWRTALVVAVAIPLTIAMTLGGMAALNVPLQQISIAALIISLGMLVDDPVVASDGINRELADGQPRGVAAWLGPFKLRRAIFFGTVINIVAFLPLALLPGDMGAFIISLPIVITLALVSSRIVSMTFIPLLGYYLLKGQKGFDAVSGAHPVHRLVPFLQVRTAIRPAPTASHHHLRIRTPRRQHGAHSVLRETVLPRRGTQSAPRGHPTARRQPHRANHGRHESRGRFPAKRGRHPKRRDRQRRRHADVLLQRAATPERRERGAGPGQHPPGRGRARAHRASARAFRP